MAPISLSIRKATPADLAAVLTLVRSAYRGESSRAGWTTEAELVDDQRIDEEGLLAKINEPFGAVLVAHDEAGDILACCEVLKQSDTVGYFGLFAVNPLRQAGGIGRTVLTAAEEYAKQTWGLTEMEMTVIGDSDYIWDAELSMELDICRWRLILKHEHELMISDELPLVKLRAWLNISQQRSTVSLYEPESTLVR